MTTTQAIIQQEVQTALKDVLSVKNAKSVASEVATKAASKVERNLFGQIQKKISGSKTKVKTRKGRVTSTSPNASQAEREYMSVVKRGQHAAKRIKNSTSKDVKADEALVVAGEKARAARAATKTKVTLKDVPSAATLASASVGNGAHVATPQR